MRYLRLRLRSSILFSLFTLTFLFLIGLQTVPWPTAEFEYREQIVEESPPQPPSHPPFWAAINQEDIFDLSATRVNRLNQQSSPIITADRIDELFELVRNARINTLEKSPSSSIASTWAFEKFLGSNSFTVVKNTNAHAETGDSGTNTIQTATNITMTAHDRIQLRYFIHRALTNWKSDHREDKTTSLADVMYDALAQDEPSRLNTPWYEYMKTVTNSRIYDPHSLQLEKLLDILQHGQISAASEMSQGTQIKVVLDLPDGFQALLKPYRVPRNYQTQPDHFYFNDIERHHAEIAAFHVDRILGFYRVPPLIGRFLNLTSEIHDKATEELAKTFFRSPANNTCFRGHCTYYCDTSHAVCGKPGDHLEGSVQVLLPRPPEVSWQKITHPYRRSYNTIRKAAWESNENYCYELVLIDEDYHNRLLLDMMDLAAFDFLIGNLDRHHMMRISSFGVNTGLVHLDNGRSFGRYDHDDLSILAPIRQCCFFRYTTFARLYRLYRQGLSKLLLQSLTTREKLQRILVDEHLVAIDRRLEILFAHLNTCIEMYTVKGVMIDDNSD